jgi:hypothetical protein
MKVILSLILVLLSFSVVHADTSTAVLKTPVKTVNKTIKVKKTEKSTKADSKNSVPQITIQNNIPEVQTDYLSAVISIVSLVLGFVLNKWYDSYTSKKKLKEIGTQWAEHFIQLKEPLEKQIEKLTEYIPLNDENHFEITDPYFNLRLDCKEFSALDDKGLIHHLNIGKNKLDYKGSVVMAGQIKDVIKLIESNSSYYKDQITIMTNEVSSHISMINPVLNEFKILVVQYWDFANSEFEENDFRLDDANRMNALMQTYILPHLDSGEFDLFKLGDEFVKPFFEATYTDRENPMMENINRHLNTIDMHIKAIRMEKKYFRIKLEKVLKSYQEQLKAVSEMIQKPVISSQ